MAVENAISTPHQMAHTIQSLLNSAIEHLHATAGLVGKAALLHNAPPFTLGRAAVETAATAHWILQRSDQAQRLANLVRFIRQGTHDYHEMAQIVQSRFGTALPASIEADRQWANRLIKEQRLSLEAWTRPR